MRILAYIIPIILIFLCINFPKEKRLAQITLGYLCLLIASNVEAPDWVANQNMYENIFSPVYRLYEPGSVMLMKISSKMGLSFIQYRYVVAIVFAIIMWNALTRLTVNVAAGSAIALIYPCLGFASGLRSAIAFALICYAFSVLFKEGDYVKRRFIFWILCATCFHYYSIINLLWLVFSTSRKRVRIDIMLGIVIMEILALGGLISGVLYECLENVVSSDKVLYWFRFGNYRHPSFWADCFLLACFLMILLCMMNTHRLNAFIQIIILLLPTIFINVTFERLLQPTIFVALCLYQDYENENLLDNTKNSELSSMRWEIDSNIIYPIWGAMIQNFCMFYIIHGNIYFSLLYNNSLFK